MIAVVSNGPEGNGIPCTTTECLLTAAVESAKMYLLKQSLRGDKPGTAADGYYDASGQYHDTTHGPNGPHTGDAATDAQYRKGTDGSYNEDYGKNTSGGTAATTDPRYKNTDATTDPRYKNTDGTNVNYKNTDGTKGGSATDKANTDKANPAANMGGFSTSTTTADKTGGTFATTKDQ
jgi:hypothetical protein